MARMPGWLARAGLGVAIALVTPTSAHAATGELELLPDPFGCLSPFNHGPDCDAAAVLNGANSVEVTPDRRFIYVGARLNAGPDRGIAAFSRDPATGGPTQLGDPAGCVTSSGSGGSCVDAVGFPVEGVTSISLSPDARHLYAASFDADAVYAFRRNRSTGALTQLAEPAGPPCISAAALESCEVPSSGASKLAQVADVVVSPDGENVYATTLNGPVLTFGRDPQTGGLAFLGGANRCISDDGAGPCADGRGLASPRALAIDARGRHVYVGSTVSDAIAILDRKPSNGRLTQAANQSGCVSNTGNGGECADAVGLDGPTDFAFSPDARFLHAAVFTQAALSSFRVDRGTGHLSQLGPGRGCLRDEDATVEPGCVAELRAAGSLSAVDVSTDGQSLYMIGALDDAILTFARNPRTGAVRQLGGARGCVTDPESPRPDCGQAEGLDHVGSGDLTLSAGGETLYHASEQDGALTSFVREVRCVGKPVTIFGTAEPERIRGTQQRDVIAAFGGDDVVRARGGRDRVCGGEGDDKLRGGPGRDKLRGGPGRDDVRD
jgi:6-phosphogluconolactonase (cycloisomerase 2 family)